jgi:hypothetical protein
MTKVVFRKFKDNGDIVALFPESPESGTAYACTSYGHVGQHCAADYVGTLRGTTPAKFADYRDLKTELENIGYRLDVRKRRSPLMMHNYLVARTAYRNFNTALAMVGA